MKTLLALFTLMALAGCEPSPPPKEPLQVTWREINGPGGGNKIYVAWDSERSVWIYVTYAGNGIGVLQTR